MRLNPQQLPAHVRGELLPVYLLTGDEPLQLMEAADTLRAAAREQGYTAREVYTVDREFGWDQLSHAAGSLSLFADKRILELRIGGSGPGKDGGQALVDYAERPAEDAVLLIQMGKLDKRSQNTRWFKALDGIGAVIQVWPVKPAALPGWLQQRLGARGLKVEREAVALLAARVEGNLLAAAQEVDKLCLLFARSGETVTLSARQVADAVADSARYSVYDLVDAAVGGEAARAVRILTGLRQEGAPPPLVLWALSNEIRNMRSMAVRLAAGEPEGRVTAAVWQSRRGVVTAGLRRIKAPTWRILVQRSARADQVIKGARPGRGWDELLQLVTGIAGGPIMSEAGPPAAASA